jgi:hydroxyacylglutathione hydrolase
VTIKPISALKDNYIWCIVLSDQTCIVVDPGDAAPVLDFLKEHHLDLRAILITHKHYDHTDGIKTLVQTNPIPVYGPPIPHVDHLVEEGDTVIITEQFNAQVLAIPGHTLEHLAYHYPGRVFTGDTLFTAGCGRVFEGTAQQMYHSLCKLNALAGETLIYCGHEYTENNLHFARLVEPNNKEVVQRLTEVAQLRLTGLPSVPATLALERKTNPFLRCDHPDVIAAATRYCQKRLHSPVAVFAVLRDWKNKMSN